MWESGGGGMTGEDGRKGSVCAAYHLICGECVGAGGRAIIKMPGMKAILLSGPKCL